MRPSQLGGGLRGVGQNRETRVYPGSAPPMEVKPTSCFVYIDDEDDLDYKGAGSLPLISRASNLSISNDLNLFTLSLLGCLTPPYISGRGRFTCRVLLGIGLGLVSLES